MPLIGDVNRGRYRAVGPDFTHHGPTTRGPERVLVSVLVEYQSRFCIRIEWEAFSKYIFGAPFRFIWIKTGGHYFERCPQEIMRAHLK